MQGVAVGPTTQWEAIRQLTLKPLCSAPFPDLQDLGLAGNPSASTSSISLKGNLK